MQYGTCIGVSSHLHVKHIIEHIQDDQKVCVHLSLYCNHQVHRDFLITLYICLPEDKTKRFETCRRQQTIKIKY